MRVIILTVAVFTYVLHAQAGEPVLNCPAPRSPEHGQSFLYQDGRTVKFVCDPGYVLLGQEMVRCEAGEWEAPTPQCVSSEGPLEASSTSPPSPPRPLFNWGDDNETAQGDEASRLRVIMYPRRRAQLYSARRVQSLTELEEEERKRADDGKKDDGATTTRTTIHLQSPPSSVLYVRRTGKTDDQEAVLREQYRRATVHLTTTNGDEGSDVQVVQLPREPVAQNDKGEDALYRQYWWAHHNYYYPREASSALVEYRAGSSPVALSESQIAWINSLHPELRDQYLRDLYVVRAGEAVEGARAQAFLRRYDPYYPYYVRQPAAAALIQDVTTLYDYTCNQAGTPFIRAPKMANAHIARYDRRQNQNRPHNHYLAAVYRCNPGYVMLDTRFTELYCSRAAWIGTEPICVPRA